MTHWCDKARTILTAGGPGSYAVAFPDYRPDLVAALADALGCRFVDFRHAILAPLGFEAHRLPLSAIEAFIAERAGDAGLVVQNAEALLAAKPAEERAQWLEAFLSTPRQQPVLLPLALFAGVVAGHPQLIVFDKADLPPETLLSQLASMRVQ